MKDTGLLQSVYTSRADLGMVKGRGI